MIEDVVTHPEHRGKGIGVQLIRSVIERCWEQQCYKVTLTSASARSDIYRFYEALGLQAFVITR